MSAEPAAAWAFVRSGTGRSDLRVRRNGDGICTTAGSSPPSARLVQGSNTSFTSGKKQTVLKETQQLWTGEALTRLAKRTELAGGGFSGIYPLCLPTGPGWEDSPKGRSPVQKGGNRWQKHNTPFILGSVCGKSIGGFRRWGVMLLMEAIWDRSRAVGSSAALADTRLPAAWWHVATPSPPAAALRVTRHLFSGG